MCGFCGIVNIDQSDVQRRDLQIMTDKMYARGPDSDGYYCEGNVGFGFRRLAIIDLESGDQPLSNEDNSIWLVMNGEIYNFVDLRKELIAKGHRFRTKSDAEVILHLYEEYGNDCVHYLNGMFAFALYDKRSRKILLGRDRLGIKPLYYKVKNNKIVFGSDARAVAQEHAPVINEVAFLAYLSSSYTAEKSIFQDVNKLPQANLLEIIGKKYKLIPYWHLSEFGGCSDPEHVAREKLLELLESSVKLQLRSDVPLGIFLSGGVDSSALVALAANALESTVNTYSIEYSNKNGDDPLFALDVAKRYKTNHTKLVLGPHEAEDCLDSLLTALDEPMADSALLATYALSKRAKEDGIKVLLSGAGGDEIFGGYSRYQKPQLFSRYWLRDFLLKRDNKHFSKLLKKINPSLQSRVGNKSLNYAAQISGADYSIIDQLLNNTDRYKDLIGFVDSEYNSINHDEPQLGFEYARMYNDLNGYLVNNILALTDKATMATSIEARVPLLDHRIVEYAYSLDPKLNLLNGEAKGLFKKALTGKLPHELLYRKKEGFNAPVKQWVTGSSGSAMKNNLLGETSETLKSLIDMKKLEDILSQGQLTESGFETIFSLYIFNRWCNTNYS